MRGPSLGRWALALAATAVVACATAPPSDYRVALPHGQRAQGYYAARISVVDDNASTVPRSAAFDAWFDYNGAFVFSWQDRTLHSALKPLQPPAAQREQQLAKTFGGVQRQHQRLSSDNDNDIAAADAASVDATYVAGGANVTTTPFDVDGWRLNVTMPVLGAPLRVWVIGDPCYNGQYVTCLYGEEWRIFDRFTGLLNASFRPDRPGDVSAWVLLGDNFYDPFGVLSPPVWRALSDSAKSAPLLSVVGNHDIWVKGVPNTNNSGDNFGAAYAQYFNMDSNAAVAMAKAQGPHATPFNLTVDPRPTKSLADVSNFFTYHRLGNAAFIVFSGAHSARVTEPLLVGACAWVATVRPAWLILLGHWAEVTFGGAPRMNTSAVFDRMATMGGCQAMGRRFKWFEGHNHLNSITRPETGFRVGGWGMKSYDPRTNFGPTLLETTDDFLTVRYFPIIGPPGTKPVQPTTAPSAKADALEDDPRGDAAWARLMACIDAHGVGGCAHLSVVWWRQPLHG